MALYDSLLTNCKLINNPSFECSNSSISDISKNIQHDYKLKSTDNISHFIRNPDLEAQNNSYINFEMDGKITRAILELTSIVSSKETLRSLTEDFDMKEQTKSSNIQSEEINSIYKPNITKRRLVLDTPFSARSTISYGLIVFAKDTQRWAIIQRKHSIEFLLFIRGLYRLTHLPLLLSCITSNEAEIINRALQGGPAVFTDIFIKELDLDPSGLKYALVRMAESRNIAFNILSKLDVTKNELKWTWPKGRIHISSNRETPFACACREFFEEVEIKIPAPLFISDTYVSENVRTITGRNIESRYWIYIIPNEITMKSPEFHPEVSNRKWVDTDTCSKILSSSNTLFREIVNIISSSEINS